MPNCYSCSNTLNADTEYGRQDTCPKCRRPTHVCLNCIFYDRSRYNECAEPSADRVVDKEASNFCDYFKPRQHGAATGESPAEKARKAAEALFKKK